MFFMLETTVSLFSSCSDCITYSSSADVLAVYFSSAGKSLVKKLYWNHVDKRVSVLGSFSDCSAFGCKSSLLTFSTFQSKLLSQHTQEKLKFEYLQFHENLLPGNLTDLAD